MAEDSTLVLALLRELKRDMSDDTRKLEESMLRMEAKFGAHADLDIERFTEIRDILMNWKGVAKVAIVLIPAGVSLVVGIIIAYISKHFF